MRKLLLMIVMSVTILNYIMSKCYLSGILSIISFNTIFILLNLLTILLTIIFKKHFKDWTEILILLGVIIYSINITITGIKFNSLLGLIGIFLFFSLWITAGSEQ